MTLEMVTQRTCCAWLVILVTRNQLARLLPRSAPFLKYTINNQYIINNDNQNNE